MFIIKNVFFRILYQAVIEHEDRQWSLISSYLTLWKPVCNKEEDFQAIRA